MKEKNISKTILITGPGGYLGSTLVKKIPSYHKVMGYGHGSRFMDERRVAGRELELVDGDINDVEKLSSVANGVDVVIHTASLVGNKACLDDPWKAIRTNIGGTITLQKALKDSYGHHVPLIVFISTQSVYGTFAKRPMPFTEELECRPDDLYGATKAESEVELTSVPTVILRLANLYGYGAGIGFKKNVISRFVESVKRGESITLYGDGSQGIDFVHVEDVSEIIVKLIEEYNIKKDTRLVLNIGSGKATPMKEIAETVLKVGEGFIDKKPMIKYTKAPPGKIWPSRWVSIKKVESVIGHLSLRDMEEGIREIYKSYG